MGTDGRPSEYSNFRFFSETVLADVLSRDLEDTLLTWHNSRGGRLGGASRFSNWLDDMPTAGWGYGALTNNRTDDSMRCSMDTWQPTSRVAHSIPPSSCLSLAKAGTEIFFTCQ